MKKDGVEYLPKDGTVDGQPGDYYTDIEGYGHHDYKYDGTTFTGTWTTTPPPTGDETDDDLTGGLNADDFASYNRLPDWGSEFIKGVSEKYTNPVWSQYQKSVSSLAEAPSNTEKARLASEQSYLSGIQKTTAEAAREAAWTGAASGTTESSVGTDYISQLAQQAVASAQDQQNTNLASADANYQNLVDKATATQAFSGLVAGYLGMTNEGYASNFGDLDLNPGDEPFKNEGSGEWNAATGFTEGQSYGTSYLGGAWWTPPEEAKFIGGTDEESVWRYEYAGQQFDYDMRTGVVSNITGTPTTSELNATEMATTSGLEEPSAAAIEGIVNTYGEKGLANSSMATNMLTAAGERGGSIEQQATTLGQQYGGLSDTTVQLLRSALGTAGLAGVGNVGGDYTAAGAQAISDAARTGVNQAGATTQAWMTSTKNKNLADAVNANKALASQIGDYLGLAKYTYDPGITEMLSYYAGQSAGGE